MINIQYPVGSLNVANILKTRKNVNVKSSNGLRLSGDLNNDQVSFGNRYLPVKQTNDKNFFEALLKKFFYSEKLYERADQYDKALARVAKSVPGCVYDKKYNDAGRIKSFSSYYSKLVRSGAKPKDGLRGTLYVQNLRDFSISSAIVNEMKKLGYTLNKVTDKNGNVKPDIDFRINNVTDAERKKLPDEFKNCISHAIKSGYSDVQISFVDKDGEPVELLLIYGKNYANAKHDEAKYVYQITRQLRSEIGNKSENIDKYSKLIEEILERKISRPIYENARILDTKDNKNVQKVSITQPESTVLINSIFEVIKDIEHNSSSLDSADLVKIQDLKKLLRETIDKYTEQ